MKLQEKLKVLADKGPRRWLISRGWYEIITSPGGVAWCSKCGTYRAEPIEFALCYDLKMVLGDFSEEEK